MRTKPNGAWGWVGLTALWLGCQAPEAGDDVALGDDDETQVSGSELALTQQPAGWPASGATTPQQTGATTSTGVRGSFVLFGSAAGRPFTARIASGASAQELCQPGQTDVLANMLCDLIRRQR